MIPATLYSPLVEPALHSKIRVRPEGAFDVGKVTFQAPADHFNHATENSDE
jgi:hypothetical protein